MLNSLTPTVFALPMMKNHQNWAVQQPFAVKHPFPLQPLNIIQQPAQAQLPAQANAGFQIFPQLPAKAILGLQIFPIPIPQSGTLIPTHVFEVPFKLEPQVYNAACSAFWHQAGDTWSKLTSLPINYQRSLLSESGNLQLLIQVCFRSLLRV